MHDGRNMKNDVAISETSGTSITCHNSRSSVTWQNRDAPIKSRRLANAFDDGRLLVFS